MKRWDWTFLLPLWFVALAGLPAYAQGSPNTITRSGLEKVRWYQAPLEIQITRGPTVREFDAGVIQNGVQGVAPGAQLPLPPAGIQSYSPSTTGNLAGGVPASLPAARFGPNVPPARNLVNQQERPPLPGGSSTNLLGRLMKPSQPTSKQAAAAPFPRRSLINRAPAPVQHLANAPYQQPAQGPPVIKGYGGYGTAGGSSSSSLQTSTSVSARLKRGALLTGN